MYAIWYTSSRSRRVVESVIEHPVFCGRFICFGSARGQYLRAGNNSACLFWETGMISRTEPSGFVLFFCPESAAKQSLSITRRIPLCSCALLCRRFDTNIFSSEVNHGTECHVLLPVLPRGGFRLCFCGLSLPVGEEAAHRERNHHRGLRPHPPGRKHLYAP